MTDAWPKFRSGSSIASASMKFTTLILLLLAAPAIAADYHVSPKGNDASGDGSAQKPFATPARAAAALAARTPETRSQPSAVILHAGAYTLRESVALTAAHSGTAQAQVVWRTA